jgi:hypothetical protein
LGGQTLLQSILEVVGEDAAPRGILGLRERKCQ